MRPVERDLSSDAHGWDVRLIAYEVAEDPGPELAEILATHLAIVEAASAPLPKERLLALLTRLKVMTQARAEQAEDLKAQLKFYALELETWPGDVAEHVLTSQPKVSKWWPAWHELEERLNTHGRDRVALLHALRQMTARCSRDGSS